MPVVWLCVCMVGLLGNLVRNAISSFSKNLFPRISRLSVDHLSTSIGLIHSLPSKQEVMELAWATPAASQLLQFDLYPHYMEGILIVTDSEAHIWCWQCAHMFCMVIKLSWKGRSMMRGGHIILANKTVARSLIECIQPCTICTPSEVLQLVLPWLHANTIIHALIVEVIAKAL